jgi:hypothetical protein
LLEKHFTKNHHSILLNHYLFSIYDLYQPFGAIYSTGGELITETTRNSGIEFVYIYLEGSSGKLLYSAPPVKFLEENHENLHSK